LSYFGKSFGVDDITLVLDSMLIITAESDLTRAESGTFVESTFELPVPVPVSVLPPLPPLDLVLTLPADTTNVMIMKNEMQWLKKIKKKYSNICAARNKRVSICASYYLND
jgi:hypothetical protein